MGGIALGLTPTPTPASATTTSWTPVFNQDFPDPAILVDGTGYVAYSTQVGLADTPAISSTDTTDWGSDRNVMPAIPSWATWGSTWAPAVAENAAGQFVEFYAALDARLGTHCIGRAVSSSPNGPFVDPSSAPFVCQPTLGGDIDPSVFADTSGRHYLLWKSDGNSIGQPSRIWSAPIDPNLDQLTASPAPLLANDQSWQDGIVENPDMVEVHGAYHLLYSGGPYDTASYATGVADCASPMGPCTDGRDNPVLQSGPGMAGPGGADAFVTPAGRLMVAFAAWPGAAGYASGGHRTLYMATLSFDGDTPTFAPAAAQRPAMVDMVPMPLHGGGYWEVAADGGVFAFGDAGSYGSMGGHPLNEPVVGMAATTDGKGYWEVAADGGIFAYGDAPFLGSMGGHPLNQAIQAMATTPDGRGYWEVAADGGVFTFGDAGFYGSMGGHPLNEPVVGIAATPDGKGYWEVAADGGIFTFGDAPFFGSMGGHPLNEPVVGIAATSDGKGYWEVAADGGIFTFGDAGFDGSMGGHPLNLPVVGMSSTTDGRGYWEVASDGGIFTFGDAPFFGSTAA
jgi:hypothetical protein